MAARRSPLKQTCPWPAQCWLTKKETQWEDNWANQEAWTSVTGSKSESWEHWLKILQPSLWSELNHSVENTAAERQRERERCCDWQMYWKENVLDIWWTPTYSYTTQTHTHTLTCDIRTLLFLDFFFILYIQQNCLEHNLDPCLICSNPVHCSISPSRSRLQHTMIMCCV